MLSNEFGYLSLHYVISLTKGRARLTENKRFKDCKAEIQIRSILQHAWAEIEHDLGYKTELEIPQKIRRRFTRIAGLLEIADTEFDTIRQRLSEYKEKVSQQILEEPSEVLLDKLSLTSFIENNVLLNEINEKIIQKTGLFPFPETEYFVGDILEELSLLGIKSISELETQLNTNQNIVTDWTILWINSQEDEYKLRLIPSNLPLLFLNNVLITQTGSAQKISNFLSVKRGFLDVEVEAKSMITIYNKLIKK